jgi:5'(3')-deoxyribonucleotidase
MRILVDVDGTVARLHDVWYDRYNKDYNDNLTEAKVIHWNLHEFVKPECGKKIYEYLDAPDLYDTVKPYDGALFAINELKKKGNQIVYVSAGVSGALAKYKWLVREGFITTEHNPEADFIVAYDKNLIIGNMIIDDRDTNVMNFPYGGILLDRPWNIATRVPPGKAVMRANSWQKVLNIMKMRELGYRGNE